MAINKDKIERQRYLTWLLRQAPTADLRGTGWDFISMNPGLALRVQQTGQRLFGDDYRYIAPLLEQFGRSLPLSRERAKNRDILFAASPVNVGTDAIIFSATTDLEFASYRLGVEIATAFDDYVFRHKNTVWSNINNRIGMKMYFSKNCDQIFDFFSGLIVDRINKGKRCLLVAKKDYLPLCAKEIECRVKDMGLAGVRVVYKDLDQGRVGDLNVIPLINYGVIGVNSFEDFDCVFCLMGYYVYEKVIDSILQDTFASDIAVQIEIRTEGNPPRRRAGTTNLKDRYYQVHRLATLALRQQEMDVVIQAVGRVRPFTKPREVVTFQCDAHPAIPYDHEFANLAEARAHFGIETKRARNRNSTAQAVKEARERGLKQQQAAEEISRSLRTVQRYWNS